MKISPLFTTDEINLKVQEIANQIDSKIPHLEQPLLVVIVLRGSLFFAADLLRAIKRETELRFITASSYKGGTESLGQVDVVMENELMQGRTVLIVEDIIDTGRTFETIYNSYQEHKPDKLYTCAFLDKPSRRVVDFSVDFSGFVIEDKFVIGYGMDYEEKFRSLPNIGVLEL